MDRIKQLILKYLREEISSTEIEDLHAWISASPRNREIFEELNDPDRMADAFVSIGALHKTDVWERISVYSAERKSAFVTEEMKQMGERGSALRLRRLRWMAAAAMIGVFVLGGYYYWYRQLPAPAIAGKKLSLPVNDVLPGGNKAILILAGGQKIVLDSAQEGLLAQQGNVQVSKTDNGKLVYHSGGMETGAPAHDAGAVAYNTLTTPRGGQYQLTLPDGTRVWLNAASSITYPTVFKGEERKVTIRGEAYFEVAKNVRQPFKVATGDIVTTVLGTSFNINVYQDEPASRTTLVEGSIRIDDKGVGQILRPGEQLRIKAKDDRKQLITAADVEGALAWKNGYFAFDEADLPALMRTLSRWYDVEVVYEGAIPRRTFSGKIGRSLTLAQVLHFLGKAKIYYTITDGRILTIAP